jgi:tetratricopeptide (TPR) repeat protein
MPIRRALILALAICALVYAFCAGFRTIGDFDFGWQIATGRFVAQHHQVPHTDVLSYTAIGTEWLYPPFAGLVFYLIFLLGGYAALSWLLAVAAAATIAALNSRPGLATGLAAILAVPSIVAREAPRAELFSTVFFSFYLLLLWRYFQGQRTRLWLLPVLMLLWVNLHLGFVTGLAMLAAYFLLEACELPFTDRRPASLQRLGKIAPFAAFIALATFLNPWGPRIYAGIIRQNNSVRELGDFVSEWSKPNLSMAVFTQMFHLRDPESSFWWLLLLAILALLVAARRKQFGAVLLLASAVFFSIQYLRFQMLAASIAVVIGGGVLDQLSAGSESREVPRADPKTRQLTAATSIVAILALILFVTTAIRCSDLITNRQNLTGGEVVLFGAGESDWFPERAVKFIIDNRLPGNLFNDYNLGGYLAWRLPEYKTYVDSRAVPFGLGFLIRQRGLLAQPLDSREWSAEADQRGINVIIMSVQRYTGLGKAPLDTNCSSHNWRPVYLDDIGAIFLRNTPQNSALINRLAIDCTTVRLNQPEDSLGNSYRERAKAYNFFANAGSLFYLLRRDREAQQYLAQAAAIEPHDSNLHLTQAQLYQADGMLSDAEREYKASIDDRPTDFAWYLLGALYESERRYPEAVQALLNSAKLSYHPADRYRFLGQIDNAMQRPKEALEAFQLAERTGSRGSLEDQRAFRAQLASGRARSWELLGDPSRAIQEQLKSIEVYSSDPTRWRALAQFYRENNDSPAADKAEARANELSKPDN